MKQRLVIGTRGSTLALWQAETVQHALQTVTELPVELKVISTRGDEQLELALHSNKLSKGLFTQELESELLSEEIDFAVHSLKDLPVEMPEGLVLAGVLERADVRDALLLRERHSPLSTLAGMKVGTSSPRRVAQLKASSLNADGVTFEAIRGNVQTRIGKLRGGDYDATVLALAGLDRLGLQSEADHILPLEVMLPAPGQGAVAIQCAASNHHAVQLAGQVSHSATELTTYVERRLLQQLGGGCALPLGAYCRVVDEHELELQVAYTPDLSLPLRRATYSVPQGDGLEEALERIAQELIKS